MFDKNIAKKFRGVFYNMRRRCNDPKNPGYKDYGGRGIKCLWNNYEDFENDMYISYTEAILDGIKPTIERIDNDGNYCKENCRWATYEEQMLNQRKRLPSSPFVNDELKIRKGAYYRRIKHWGWDMKKALSTPPRRFPKIIYNGEERSIYSIAKENKIHPAVVCYRIKKLNWNITRAVTEKVAPYKKLEIK